MMEPLSKHICHAKGCQVPVPPKLFMCRRHWYQLPLAMRNAIWKVYVPGQEITKQASADYRRVAAEAVAWLSNKEGE